MSKNTPTPPAAPDYAAANEAAINADIRTLPLRNAINAASQLGTSYTDPTTGQLYDFTGLGQADINAADLKKQLELAPDATAALLKLQQDYGTQFADESLKQLKALDPTGYDLRESFGDRLAAGTGSIESLFSGGAPASDYESYVRNNPDLLRNWEENVSKNTGLTIAQYGQQHYDSHGKGEGREMPMTRGNGVPNFESYSGNGPTMTSLNSGPSFGKIGPGPSFSMVDSNAIPGVAGANLQSLNAVSFQERGPMFEMLGGAPGQQQVGPARQQDGGPAFQTMMAPMANERISTARMPPQQTIGESPMFKRMSEIAQINGVNGARLVDDGAAAGGRASLERQIFDELDRAGKDDPVLRRAAEQAARARGAASGNILGDSSALQESMAVQLAQRDLDNQRRSNALSLLSSGQTSSDTRNRLQQEQMAADIASTGFNNAANQQNYQNVLANTGFNNDATQQEFNSRLAAAGFNNDANAQGLQNRLAAAGFNNQANAQDLSNLASVLGFNNAAQQQGYQNRVNANQDNFANSMAQAGFNNQAMQQNFNNAATSAAFNNAARQQDYQNRDQANQDRFANLLAQAGFNNAAAQQDYQNRYGASQDQFKNRIEAAGFNNAAAQQGYQNQVAAAGVNNANAQQQYQNYAAATNTNNANANQAFQNAMAAINQRNQTAQNQYAAGQSAQQAKAGARQQDLANIQSFLGLQPIVSQGSQLSGLQQGAAPFMQNNAYGATMTNPNAGAQGTAFASNIFGTQAGIYGQQLQNSQSPLGALAGGLFGAATGGLGKIGGAALGNTLFPKTFSALYKG